MNNELQQASPMDATLRGNILIAEFEGRKFYPREGIYSLYKDFDTYAECAAYIKKLNLPPYQKFTPSLGWNLGCGLYNKEWSWLIRAWCKFHKLVLATWYHPHKKDIAEAEKIQFETWVHNFHSGVDADCVQCSFEIMVGALTWFNFLNKKEAGNETAK